jgi:hypothetical protein
MTNSGSHDAAATSRGPRRFFQKQLAGEQPLSFETASQLYELAMALLMIEPWKFLDDENLVLVPDVESGEICYCGVMGALGQVFSFQVYAGEESYRFFRRIAAGKPITPGDFYASVRGVSAEFVTAKGQTPPDRELLEALGHRKERGKRAPIFRAFRPGYHPWYVTEREAKLLISCLEALLGFCSHLIEMGEVDYWKDEDVFPFVSPNPKDKTGKNFLIRPAKAPEPPAVAPQPAELDENLISAILLENLPRQGALEADHFFTDAVIGKDHERKACLRMAMTSDAHSGFAFQPALGTPEDSTGQLLVQALLSAIHGARLVPAEVRVRQKDFKILLSALSERLGFEVRVTKSLPAVDELMDHFLRMVEGTGEF